MTLPLPFSHNTPTTLLNSYLKAGLKVDLEGQTLCRFHSDPDKAKDIRVIAEIHATVAGQKLEDWIGNFVVEHLKKNPTPEFTGWIKDKPDDFKVETEPGKGQRPGLKVRIIHNA